MSPSIPTADRSFETISKPIHDLDDPLGALPPKSYNDPIINSGNPKDELKSISLIPMTHPSLEEDSHCHEEGSVHPLIKLNPRAPNSRKILDNERSIECHWYGMMEIMFLPMDIHKTLTLKLEKEEDNDEHESYILTIPLNPCVHEKSSKSIFLSTTITFKIYNSFMLLVHKNSKREVVDAFVYHKHCKSRSGLV